MKGADGIKNALGRLFARMKQDKRLEIAVYAALLPLRAAFPLGISAVNMPAARLIAASCSMNRPIIARPCPAPARTLP